MIRYLEICGTILEGRSWRIETMVTDFIVCSSVEQTVQRRVRKWFNIEWSRRMQKLKNNRGAVRISCCQRKEELGYRRRVHNGATPGTVSKI